MAMVNKSLASIKAWTLPATINKSELIRAEHIIFNSALLEPGAEGPRFYCVSCAIFGLSQRSRLERVGP